MNLGSSPSGSNTKQNKITMKKILLTATATLAITCAAQAQWNGGSCNRQANVTINRYNYYPQGQAGYGCGNYYRNNWSQWGYNGYGQQIPNGLGWTLFGIQTAMQLFAPRPQAAYVQYPMYQSPAPVVIYR